MADNKLQRFLDKWAKKVAVNAVKVIDKTVAYSGGQSTSLSETVKEEALVYPDGTASVTISMADYYRYIEYGRRAGKMPPSNKLEFFVRARNLKLTPPKTLKGKAKSLSYDKQVKSLAFIIARSIGKKGVKARPFVKDILTPELMNELRQGLADNFKEQFIIDLTTE